MSGVAGWRLALRLAWRESLRARGRSLLVLAMIALPVMGVVSADVLIRTAQVSASEGVDRYLGTTAAARVAMVPERTTQGELNPFGPGISYAGGTGTVRALADVKDVLGAGRTYAPFVAGSTIVGTTAGQAEAKAFAFDPSSPLSSGLMRLTSGRWPTAAGEVVVNAAFAAHGPGLGGRLTMKDGGHDQRTATIVGIAESSVDRTTYVVGGLPGTIPWASVLDGTRGWLVGGGDVTLPQVLALNRIGALTLSRYLVAHPAAFERLYPEDSPVTPAFIAIVSMIVVMALLEVVLLAGPAFAVSAKRQARSLALVAASGGTPAQSRRTILAAGLVIGLLGSVTGLVLGLGLARLAEPLLQQRASTWLGPFDIRWHELLVVALFGLLSAFLAAVVPAWLASRQDVVAVLAGRRGDRRPSYTVPVAGIVILGLGVIVAVGGTRARSSAGAVMISASALICVLGMILIVPVVVAGLARLGGRLPLPLRFAVRDGARHRSRTVPAISAVAAVVAGAVTLGIAVASDQAHGEAEYVAQIPIGQASVDVYSARTDWGLLESTVRAQLPDSRVTVLRGALLPSARKVPVTGTVRPPHGRVDLSAYTGFGNSATTVLVSDGSDLVEWPGVSPAQLDAARTVLAGGGAVAFTHRQLAASTGTVELAARGALPRVTVATAYLTVPVSSMPPQAIISPQVARRLGLRAAPMELRVSGASISAAAESRLSEALAAQPGQPSFYVERGYRPDQTVRLLELVLTALSALLMLGGTLTTTSLALSDARPDLATLAAIGAAPRTRRWVAAAYSLSIGLVGALLGVVVGMVPGVALTYPLTGTGWQPPGQAHVSHYLAMPWGLLAAIVLGLPLAVSLAVALAVRGRLPMVARLT